MIKKHSVTIKGHGTSIALEPEFWNELKIISQKTNKSIQQIITAIDETNDNKNLSSQIRIFILNYIKNN